eukprot:6186726-Pleurochrysis_carterae.AAC.1
MHAVYANSTHAMLTLTADGSSDRARNLRLRCAAPGCIFDELPLAGDAPGMYYLRLGSAAEIQLEMYSRA